ncbi:hypothetical protein RGQ13_00635 [Thalassotalea psychrophila]|uniref:Uncharacterized protein n=1 Tax=Thalassotalea psychrophila TaxID=3065647 RepID=A0ABY9TUK2_9GAMM|nr:hypothetical protein RGQ13_00635 [Colwelliaceae bacterium SQ149]
MKTLIALALLVATMGAGAEEERGCYFEPWTNIEIMNFDYNEAAVNLCIARHSIKSVRSEGVYASDKIDRCNVEIGRISLLLAAKHKADWSESMQVTVCEGMDNK